jgi:predicted nucleotidyltransferase
VAIRALAPDAEVILFGSRATGTARADSDYDFLVVAETEDRFALALRLTEALEPVFPRGDFDLVVVRRQDWDRARRLRGFVAYEADRTGIPLGA